MIEVKNLTKTYKTGNKALKEINIQIQDGEFVFIMGRSGSGKSTLLKLLLKELEPTSGQIIVNDMDLEKMPRRYIPKYRRRLGMVFQDFRLLKDKTVYENVAFAQRVIGVSPREIKKNVPEMLRLVGLSSKYKAYPNQLSGGERQRISIARALLKNAPVVILDEPTAALDIESELAVQKAIDNLVHNRTVIIIAHRLSTIAGAGNILVMEEGQVVEQGTHAQLLSHHGRYQALWQAQMAARVWRDDGGSASGEWVHE